MSDAFERFRSAPRLAEQPESLRYQRVLTSGQPASTATKAREKATKLLRRRS